VEKTRSIRRVRDRSHATRIPFSAVGPYRNPDQGSGGIQEHLSDSGFFQDLGWGGRAPSQRSCPSEPTQNRQERYQDTRLSIQLVVTVTSITVAPAAIVTIAPRHATLSSIGMIRSSSIHIMVNSDTSTPLLCSGLFVWFSVCIRVWFRPRLDPKDRLCRKILSFLRASFNRGADW